MSVVGAKVVGVEPALLLHDDRRHGVARYAADLCSAVEGALGLRLGVRETDWSSGEAPARIHTHFTDRLWAASPEQAAARLVAVAAGRRLSVTLHDVPQPSDGHALARRTDAYRRVIAAAELVVVNSRHELALLESADLRPARVAVVPLPVPAVGPSRRPDALDPVVAVLGFIYPGKGHRETIDAIAASGTSLAFAALGGPSAGHDSDAAELIAHGAAVGVAVTISGYLSDERFDAAARSAAVPVIAHQHLSASGSMPSWIGAGRRPLVLRSRYTEEMDALRPGTLTLVGDGDLPQAIARAHDDPGSTFLEPSASTRPDLADAATAYLRAWRGETP